MGILGFAEKRPVQLTAAQAAIADRGAYAKKLSHQARQDRQAATAAPTPASRPPRPLREKIVRMIDVVLLSLAPLGPAIKRKHRPQSSYAKAAEDKRGRQQQILRALRVSA